MKYLSLLLILVTFGITEHAHGQSCYATVETFKTIPERLTKLDSIKIYVRIFASGSASPEYYFNSSWQTNSLKIEGCYGINGATTWTIYEHIINLGMPTDTVYHLYATTYTGFFASCNTIIDTCNFDTTFRILPQPYIDSISIFPPNPMEDDEVMMVTHASTTRPGKKLSLGYYTNISSGEIFAKGCYAITDSFLQDEQYDDTVKLGKLRAGDYNFNFKAYLSDDTSVCGNRVDSSMMSKAFHVQPLLSAGSVAPDKILSIYPNPASNTLYIRKHALMDIESVQVRDMQGRIVVSGQEISSIDVYLLPKGMYFVQVVTNKGAAILKFVKE
jgi:hypothetical protein